MSAEILDFAPAEGFIEITNPGRWPGGEPVFFIEYHFSRAEGGGQGIMWDGTTRESALAAAEEWTRYGTRCVDRTASAD